NRFLVCPTPAAYKPWKSYTTEVGSPSIGYGVDTARHYYHYWQVYQLYLLKKRYPIFSEHPDVLRHLQRCDENPLAIRYAEKLSPLPGNPASTINGMFPWFDALSFYIHLYHAEEERAFDSDKAVEGWITIRGKS